LTIAAGPHTQSAERSFSRESLGPVRENSASVEQSKSAGIFAIDHRSNLADMEGKAEHLKHQMVEKSSKSGGTEMVEKKAQNPDSEP